MRFVENHGAVFGKHAAEIVLLERQVGEKKMVIHDDQVGLGGALVHRREETPVELRAFGTGAGVAARVEALPQIRIVGQKIEFRAVARGRHFFPVANLRETSPVRRGPSATGWSAMR